MRQILTDPLIEILRNRVALSRETKIYSIGNIAKEWGMSNATLFRYDSPEYRLLSRIYSKQQKVKVNRLLCQICGDPLKNHPRCHICTQLSHSYSLHSHFT